jgi:hypothetical protein
LPLSRKYASLVRFWSFVLNTERGCFEVSKSSTSAFRAGEHGRHLLGTREVLKH